jgi:membrane protease YdiL (CAAX protease family)
MESEDAIKEMNQKKGAGVLNDRLLAAWEIASVTVTFLIAEWVVFPFAANSKIVFAFLIVLALGLMLLSHQARGESAHAIGWRVDNFFHAVKLLLIPMIIIAALFVGLGFLMKGLRFDRAQVIEWSLTLPLWGLAQQYVLQGFINRRAQKLYGQGWQSVLLVAAIFALLHLPNPWLTVFTFLGGAVWAYVYQRAPNLLALALSHALMSMMLALSLPPATINSLRVGIKYFG